MERVVISGIGAVTPLGTSFTESWMNILNGRSGIRPLTRIPSSVHRWALAGEIPFPDSADFLCGKKIRSLDPFVRYATAAAHMAVEDANLTAATGSAILERASVMVGSSRAGISTLESAGDALRNGKKLSPFVMPASTLFMAPATIAEHLGIHGECLGVSTACASGAHAVGEAFRQIQLGIADIALAGGTEAPLSAICFEGYGRAGALTPDRSPEASRPFDRKRNGFVLAEGACIMVLENLRSAVRRNAPIYAEIAGYVNRTDGYHLTQPHLPSQIAALRAALHTAGLPAEKVDYINAHGTSTQLGDRIEAEAIRAVFGDRPVPVSALKSMTGHMLAGSAAFELACTAMSIRDRVIPPTINITDPDPACRISLATSRISMPIHAALTQSFGFGGANAVLVLKQVL